LLKYSNISPLAIAMETGAGYAIYETRRWGANGENAEELREKFFAVQSESIACERELQSKENKGKRFEDKSWRDFSHSMLNDVCARASGGLISRPSLMGRVARPEFDKLYTGKV
jgi:hypothetical protein